jgi:hypothetical protein
MAQFRNSKACVSGKTAKMPLPESTTIWEWETDTMAAAEPAPAGTAVVNVSLIHELGTRLNGGTIETTRFIGPSKRPTIVKIESQVVAQGAQRIYSPDYMATVRRRKSREIARAIADLAEHADRQDIGVRTYPIVRQLGALLETLSHAEAEGNTREILRQVRNTFMNGGWQKYRDSSIRSEANRIMDDLAEAEEIFPEKVDEVFDRLSQVHLNPVGSPAFALDEEDDTADAQEQVSS